jgi:hypothetical protein
LLCVRGKERQLSVALLCKVVNDLLGWILDIFNSQFLSINF